MEMCQRLVLLALGASLALASVDEFMSCDRYFENARTARVLDHIPCDMTKTTYCKHKGSAYPENAIWRFKEENRALMRRLYGDLESNSVYREMRSANLPNLPSEDHSFFSNMQLGEYNIRVGSGLATVKSARKPIVEPGLAEHRLPNQKKVLVKKKRKTSSRPRPTSTTEEATRVRFPGSDSNPIPETTTATESPVTESTAANQYETTLAVSNFVAEAEVSENEIIISSMDDKASEEEITTIDQEVTDVTSVSPLENTNTASPDFDTTTTDLTTETTVTDFDTLIDNVTAVTETENEDELLNVTEIPEPRIASTTISTSSPTTSASPKEAANQEHNFDSNLSELLSEEDIESLEQLVGEMLSENEGKGDQLQADFEVQDDQADDSKKDEQDKNEFDYEYAESDEEDDAGEEEEEELLYTGPSVNACPVKEEVFAPYWANNTRDQVLALLNLYPFEQYIHMETCKFEKEEMMCRKGCRCEQQYRLHRLLAFDPNNECRGIFSDWFRFPSYCVCKCYSFTETVKAREPRKPKIESSRSGYKKEMDFQHESVKSTRSIPPFLPYEAKEALLKEMSRSERKMDVDKANMVEGSVVADTQMGIDADEAKEADREKNVPRKVRDSADHFLYGNIPVVEYQLSDGTGGYIRKTPR